MTMAAEDNLPGICAESVPTEAADVITRDSGSSRDKCLNKVPVSRGGPGLGRRAPHRGCPKPASRGRQARGPWPGDAWISSDASVSVTHAATLAVVAKAVVGGRIR